MANKATQTQTLATSEAPAAGAAPLEKVPQTKEEREAAYRAATLRADLETLKPGDVECTGVWFPDNQRLPNGDRQIILGKSLSISQLTGRVEKIVREANGCVRLHMDIQSGNVPAGTRSYVFFGTNYHYAEAMPSTPEMLGMVHRL